MNSFTKTDREFHWYKAYSVYLVLPIEDALTKNLRASERVKVGCMPEVFVMLILILWCAKCFDVARRVIWIGDTAITPIILNPLMFLIVLRLPNPNIGFKIVEVDAFIANHGGPKRLLVHFTDSLYGIKTSSFEFDIGILKETFRELTWLFA